MSDRAKEVRPRSHVLDVGAGSSPYRHLFNHTEFRTHDFGQLKPEQLLGKKGYAPIDYVSDIKSIPAPAETFDVIVCTEVLKHVAEPIAAPQEIAHLCKPGGTILVTAPLMSGLHQTPSHFYGGYTLYFYSKFLGELGFNIERLEPNGNLFKLYAQEMSRFLRCSAQWGLAAPLWAKLIWFPFWLSFSPGLFALIFVGHALDRFDE